MNILDTIDSVDRIRALNDKELLQLCTELRRLIIETTLQNGGHLSSNLGVIELTVALLRCFDVPKDKIVFDVGHQSYAYKILTGRYKQFSTLRKKDGLAGFPRTSESEYDAFTAGHASTSISAGLGLARARDICGQTHHVVSVVGDGALTGGMCYEAMDDGGTVKTPFIVILNDNRMSIARSVGGVSQYLSRLRTGRHYRNFKKRVQKTVTAIPKIGPGLALRMERMKNRIKYFLLPNIIFEELGFTYIGPSDGHDIQKLCDLFEHAKTLKQPCFLHVITQKGKGYVPAEANPEKYHGVAPYRVEPAVPEKKTSNSAVAGQTLETLAQTQPHLAAITAAMPSGTGLEGFGKKYPARFFDVGIAEEHAVTMAAGLASGGVHPFFAVYSTFLQRGYDQLIHDVCLQKLGVTLLIDRAGLVGEDGDTHQGVFDIAMLLSMPHMTLLSPATQTQLRRMMEFAAGYQAPLAIRYPRTPLIESEPLLDDTPLFSWTVKHMAPVTIVATGKMWPSACQTARCLLERGITAGLVHAGCLKPMDQSVVLQLSQSCEMVVTMEDGAVNGGFGQALCRALNEHKPVKTLCFGMPDEFVPHGTVEQLWEMLGLTPMQMAERIISEREAQE